MHRSIKVAFTGAVVAIAGVAVPGEVHADLVGPVGLVRAPFTFVWDL